MATKRGVIQDINWPTVIKGVLVVLSGIGLTGGVFYSASAPEASASPIEAKFNLHSAVDSVNRIETNKKLDKILEWIETTDSRLINIEITNSRIEGKLE